MTCTGNSLTDLLAIMAMIYLFLVILGGLIILALFYLLCSARGLMPTLDIDWDITEIYIGFVVFSYPAAMTFNPVPCVRITVQAQRY